MTTGMAVLVARPRAGGKANSPVKEFDDIEMQH